jgi:hypothetical protein
MNRFMLLLVPMALTAAACSSPNPPTQSVTYEQVLNRLNQCEAFEMGTAEPPIHFGKPAASGNEMCGWRAQQTGASLTCLIAGRVYSIPPAQQTGYGVWACGRQDVVSPDHNGWALCCPATL